MLVIKEMKKILVVEDDYDIGEIVEMALSSKYDILIKQDSIQLLDVIKQFMPDVILIDNFIGHKEAKEIIKEINFDSKNLGIPIILFSGHPSIATIAIEIGAIDYLPKPFNLDDLDNCVARVLSTIE